MASLTTEEITTMTNTTDCIGPQLNGIWKEVSISNLDAFLAAIGIGWLKRKAAAMLIKVQTHIILYDEATQTIIIRTLGKRGGPDENKINIGKPTQITAQVVDPDKMEDSKTTGAAMTLNMSWNDKKDILLNDLEVENIGELHVERSIIGKQMKVEVTHKKSGVTMYRMFDKVDGSESRVSEDSNGKIKVEGKI
jgi:hypothetical protein